MKTETGWERGGERKSNRWIRATSSQQVKKLDRLDDAWRDSTNLCHESSVKLRKRVGK